MGPGDVGEEKPGKRVGFEDEDVHSSGSDDDYQNPVEVCNISSFVQRESVPQ